MSSSSSPYDLIVIGAGMSGLAAGLRAALFDQRVLVLERHYLWGGLNSFYKKKGRHYDVGLHALTNFCKRGARGKPLTRLLRQLRIPYGELELGEQTFSRIAFPDAELSFDNDFERLREGVHRLFPARIDAFEALVREIDEAGFDLGPGAELSGRAVLSEKLREPLLEQMLLLPTAYYGSGREDDVDWGTFRILFQSLFAEGFCRPEGGIRPLLKLLRRRYLEEGGELRMKSGVKQIVRHAGRAVGVELENGEIIEAKKVFSSAGWAETLGLCGDEIASTLDPRDVGQVSFIESISVLDREPKEIAPDAPGCNATITFFNDAPHFDYRPPTAAKLFDSRSGVVCCPNNYAMREPLPDGLHRLTMLASPTGWNALEGDEYNAAKNEAVERTLDVSSRYTFDPRPYTMERDTFTPKTIRRFTGHVGGAVYGSPNKRIDGRTPLENLFIIGTDQGFVGVVGTMLSGVMMTNQQVLRDTLATVPVADSGASA